MISLRDVPYNSTADLDLCAKKALFLANLSSDTVKLIGVLVFVGVLFLFWAFVAFDLSFLMKENETIVMSKKFQTTMEVVFVAQTLGILIWGVFFLLWWLGYQKTRHCSNEIPTSDVIFFTIAVHGFFPPAAMSWFNTLRDVCTGREHCGNHRLRGGLGYLLLVLGLIFSPLVLIGLGIFGIVRLCRSCCRERDPDLRSVDSGIELISINTQLLSKGESADTQSEEPGWDAETVVG